MTPAETRQSEDHQADADGSVTVVVEAERLDATVVSTLCAMVGRLQPGARLHLDLGSVAEIEAGGCALLRRLLTRADVTCVVSSPNRGAQERLRAADLGERTVVHVAGPAAAVARAGRARYRIGSSTRPVASQ
ncbi:MAG: hypothetical protein OEY23_14700 [Acidimicrobiia bacterium]|nr:hypothetical protein [Acidimicrobiia bacterium]